MFWPLDQRLPLRYVAVQLLIRPTLLMGLQGLNAPAVAFQQCEGVLHLEVLKLQDGIRPPAHHSTHKLQQQPTESKEQ